MRWYLNLSTRGKLGIGFGLMGILFTVVIMTAFSGLTSIKSAQRSLYRQEFANARDFLVLRSNLNGIHASLLGMIVETQDSKMDYWLQDIKQRGEVIGEITQRLQQRNRNDARLVDQLQELYQLGEAFILARDDDIIKMIYAGQTEAAKGIIFGIQNERKEKMRALAKEMGDNAIGKAQEAMLASEQRVAHVVNFIVAIGLASIALGLLTVQLLNRVIAVPLTAASAIAAQIATGDLTVKIPEEKRSDENCHSNCLVNQDNKLQDLAKS